jgi:hypothetical protein
MGECALFCHGCHNGWRCCNTTCSGLKILIAPAYSNYSPSWFGHPTRDSVLPYTKPLAYKNTELRRKKKHTSKLGTFSLDCVIYPPTYTVPSLLGYSLRRRDCGLLYSFFFYFFIFFSPSLSSLASFRRDFFDVKRKYPRSYTPPMAT